MIDHQTSDLATYAAMRTVFDETSHLVWLLTPEGTVTDVNRTALVKMGGTTDTVVGTALWTNPWWSPESAIELKELFTGSTPARTRIPLRLQNSGSAPVWLEFSIKPILGSDQDIMFLLAEGKDVSVQHIALAHLRAAEAFLEEGQIMAKMGSWVVDARTSSLTSSEGLNRVFGLAPDSPSMTIEEYQAAIYPEDRDIFARVSAGYAESGETPDYDMRILRPDGETRILHGTWRAETNSENQIKRFIGTSQDVTEQRRAESRLAHTVERLSTLTTKSQSLTARWHQEGLYEHVTEVIASLIEANTVMLLICEEETLIVRGVHGEAREGLIGTAMEWDVDIAAHTWQRSEATVIRGAESVTRLNTTVLENLSYRPQAIVAVPLKWEKERVGVIKVLHSNAKAFTEEDISVLQIVGAWVAIALLNAQLWETEQKARQLAESRRERIRALARRIVSTQEAERQRIARELHDETGQVLTALKMKLALLRKAVQDSEQQENLNEAITMISDLMKNVRHIAHDLRPPALDTFGLEAALEGMCGEYSRHTGIAVSYEGEQVPPCSDDVKIALYRFVQEALTNIGKHSGATEATVRLSASESDLRLEVSDNGSGFDPEATAHGIGLVGMEERLDWLEGTLDILAKVGQGTRLTATVPL